MGSMGTRIGGKVAERLGMKYVDKEIISKIMQEYGYSQFVKIYNEIPGFWERFDSLKIQTMNFMTRTIEAIGAHDNVVIVGRGGFEIFMNYRDVLNVRTHADIDLRIKRKSEEYHVSLEEAKAQVEENDKIRRAFLEDNLKHSCGKTEDFDIVVNTGVVTIERAVDLICDAYKELMAHGRNADSKQLKDLKVDPILKEYVSKLID